MGDGWMDYAAYTRELSFRYLKPHMQRPHGLRAASRLLKLMGVHLEMLNTCLPANQRRMRKRLREVCKVPRMSTFAIGALINQAVSQMPGNQAFVNVGVWNGFTFFAGMANNASKKCIGVDNFSHRNSPRDAFLSRFQQFRGGRHQFYEMDYGRYFSTVHHGLIGCYVLDGPHNYQHQYNGLKVAEPFIAKGGIIVIDDTNWDDVRQPTLDFVEASQHEYRILLDVQTPKSGHPTFWNGIMVLQKGARPTEFSGILTGHTSHSQPGGAGTK